MNDIKHIIWQVVASIPKGRVATYGEVARAAGYPNHARYVGNTLKNLPADTRLPWFRVINAKGEISFPIGSEAFATQCRLLEAEGVVIRHNRVSLALYGWKNQRDII